MSLLDAFPHRCTIQRRTNVKDAYGGRKTTYVTEQLNVVCWQQPAGDAEDAAYQKNGMRITHKIYFRANPNVTPRHRILVTYYDGATVVNPNPLDVISLALPDSSAGMGVCYRVLCTESSSEDD